MEVAFAAEENEEQVRVDLFVTWAVPSTPTHVTVTVWQAAAPTPVPVQGAGLTVQCAESSDCPPNGTVEPLQRVRLTATRTGGDPTMYGTECPIGDLQDADGYCNWRLRKEVLDAEGRITNQGEFLDGGNSTGFTWVAPTTTSADPVEVTIGIQFETNLEYTLVRQGRRTLNFTMQAPTETRTLDMDISCWQANKTDTAQKMDPNDHGDTSACVWDLNNLTDTKITLKGRVDATPNCSGMANNGAENITCVGEPEWRFYGGAAGRTEAVDPDTGYHRQAVWTPGNLEMGDHDQIGLSVGNQYGSGRGQTAFIQVRDTNEPPEIGRQDNTGRRIDGITCQLDNPDGQDQVDLDSCTVLRGYTGGAANTLSLRLGVKDPDSEHPDVEWSGSGMLTPEGSSALNAYATWDSTGLSVGQYTLTATVTENRGAGKPTSDFRATRTVRVTVEDYDAPPDTPREPTAPDRTQTCDPDYQGTLLVGDLYCGHRHSSSHTWTGFTPHSDYVWSRAVGSAGQSSVTLENSTERTGMKLRARENRICGIARGVCGEYVDTQVHSEGGNVYQWVNYTPEP